jgi:aspartate carbamoyltransferase catalytic subunit
MPRELLQGEHLTGMPPVEVETDLDKAIEDTDVIMALRLQTERQTRGMLPSIREYTRRWLITPERYRRAKPNALLMHPGPLNEGIEISSALAHGVGSGIEEQVSNGVAVRMALLYLLLTGGATEEIIQ